MHQSKILIFRHIGDNGVGYRGFLAVRIHRIRVFWVQETNWKAEKDRIYGEDCLHWGIQPQKIIWRNVSSDQEHVNFWYSYLHRDLKSVICVCQAKSYAVLSVNDALPWPGDLHYFLSKLEGLEELNRDAAEHECLWKLMKTGTIY